MRLIAVDSGPVHCGVVVIDATPGIFGEMPWEYNIKIAEEYSPSLLRVFLDTETAKEAVLVVEAFALHPWQAKRRSYSSMPESELIGQIKYIWSKKYPEGTLLMVKAAEHKRFRSDLVLRELKSVRKGAHVRDALSIALWALTFKILPIRHADVEDLRRAYIGKEFYIP